MASLIWYSGGIDPPGVRVGTCSAVVRLPQSFHPVDIGETPGSDLATPNQICSLILLIGRDIFESRFPLFGIMP
jgi:hypothetical protein